jgi:hypothetical protein
MKIVSPPGGVAAGWDAADALAEGWTTTQAAALISEAKPFKLRKSSRGDASKWLSVRAICVHGQSDH